MGGFIVLEDGRAFAASNWGTNAVIRAIAAEVAESNLRCWLLDQLSTVVGPGLTCVDIREVAPQFRFTFYAAARAALARVIVDGFEDAPPGWLNRFADLVEMIDRWQAGENPANFNPHMRSLVPPTGSRKGPGWT